MATATKTEAAAEPVTRGFAAPCPHCGTVDGITVYLDDLNTSRQMAKLDSFSRRFVIYSASDPKVGAGGEPIKGQVQ